MTNILETLSVNVHCDQCGDFSIGANLIAESQRMLAEGCPGSSHECPPTLFATLLPRSTLEALEKAWNDLERAVRSPVRQVTIEEPCQVSTPGDGTLDSHTISRWEDDGGYVPPPQSAPC